MNAKTVMVNIIYYGASLVILYLAYRAVKHRIAEKAKKVEEQKPNVGGDKV